MVSMSCGIDWSERYHDVALADEQGRIIRRRRIADDASGFTHLVELLAEHADGDPTAVPVAIETEKGVLVAALRAAGYTVYAINPRAVARYRERYGQAGGKSDSGDAAVLAHILRTDRPAHRPLPRDSAAATAVKQLARQHQEAIWARQQTVNRLRSLLRDFYPAAVAAFPNLTHKAALTVLEAAPNPGAGATLTAELVTALLRHSGRGDRLGLAERLVGILRAPVLRHPEPVEHALGAAVVGLVRVIAAMQAAIADLERALLKALEHHPSASALRSLPGLGPVLAARVLGELGDDPARFTGAAGLRAYAGTAPVTRASGRSRVVSARYIRNRRLADACHWWAFSALTRSPGVRAHYDRRRAAGDSHVAALRNVANRLLSRLWFCLRTGTSYDEHAAWAGPRLDTRVA